MSCNRMHLASMLVLAALFYTFAQAAPPDPKTVPVATQPPIPVVLPKEPVKTAAPASSVLERFRVYAGPRTPAAMSALFGQPLSANVRQLPEVALSNGATLVTLEATLPAGGATAPNFACSGARLMSNIRSPKGEWQIKILPDTGVTKADLIVLADSSVLEIPLTVAPPLPAETDLSEKAFSAFLVGAAPAAKPAGDLNGDGRRDYQDDYIFTANYLVRLRSGAPAAVQAAAEPEESPLNQNPDSLKPDINMTPDVQQKAADQGTVPQAPNSLPGSGSSRGTGFNPTTHSGTSDSSSAAGTSAGTSNGTETLPVADASTKSILDHTVVKKKSYAEQQKIRNEQAIKNNQLIKAPNPVEVIN